MSKYIKSNKDINLKFAIDENTKNHIWWKNKRCDIRIKGYIKIDIKKQRKEIAAIKND